MSSKSNAPVREQPKLFRRIADETIATVMGRLQVLRREHPEYRDDQLLLYYICREVEAGRLTAKLSGHELKDNDAADVLGLRSPHHEY